MELVKENVTVNQVNCKGSVRTTVDEDIIVPDVKPDIVKILQLDASACVASKTVSDGRAVVSGNADLKILYIPDSASEKIKSILTSFDFSQTIDNRSIDSSMKAIVTANVEKAEFSLINSRKLRVKLTIDIDYEIVEEKNIEIAVDCDDGGSAQILRESVTLQNCVGLTESEFTLRENIEIPSAQTSVGEILKADARVTDSEYKTVTGKIIAKGAAAVSVLYTDDEGKICFLEEELPFTEVFECDGAGDDTVCDIDYTIAQIRCEATEDGDGDRRLIAMEISVIAQIKATENVPVDMISDCYEPYMKTQLIKEETELEEIVSRPKTQNTIRETIEVGEGMPAIAGVYDVITRPYITGAELSNGRLNAEGKIEAYILYLTDNEENPVYSVRKEIPFSCSADSGSDDDSLTPEIKAEVRHTAYNLNMAGEIELRVVIGVNANIIRKRKIELISDVVTENRAETGRRGIVIYFVQPGDSLWEIAKRYAVPRESVLSFNNLTEDSEPSVGARLFIPGV